MNVRKWFPHEPAVAGNQLHVLRLFQRTGRALEDCKTHFPIIVGRGADVDVRIDDRAASRIHCGLTRANGRIVVTDLEARNGTFVNGRQIRQCVVSEGDEIRVGETTLVVINAEDEAVLAIDVKD